MVFLRVKTHAITMKNITMLSLGIYIFVDIGYKMLDIAFKYCLRDTNCLEYFLTLLYWKLRKIIENFKGASVTTDEKTFSLFHFCNNGCNIGSWVVLPIFSPINSKTADRTDIT
jgi:hypothetical protein